MTETHKYPGAAAFRPAMIMHLVILLATYSLLTAATGVKWTILVYMVADNNLECFGLQDLQELTEGMAVEPQGCLNADCGAECGSGYIQVGSMPCIQGDVRPRCCPSASYPDILVMMDRGAASCVFNPPSDQDADLLDTKWSTAKEILVVPGGRAQQIRDYSEQDMSDPQTLADFLQRSMAAFPPGNQRKHMLIFWDHGAGWDGYGVDHTCSPTSTYNAKEGCNILTLGRLTEALRKGLTLGDGTLHKLDIIGFDACLMGMYEVASYMKPYADYLLASELLEPGHGWDYRAVGDIAGQGHTVDGPILANYFVEGYFRQAASQPEPTAGLTLALVDLALMGKLEEGMALLNSKMVEDMDSNPGLAVEYVRRRMLMSEVTGVPEHVDLGTFFKHLQTVNPNVQTAARLAWLTYNTSVVAFRADNEMKEASGLAIYFPRQQSSFARVKYQRVTKETPLGSWTNFLDTLYVTVGKVANGNLSFIEDYAVPYMNTSLGAYFMEGTLNSTVAVGAVLNVGIRAPDGTPMWMLEKDAVLKDNRVISSWAGFAWFLKQSFASINGEETRVSLMYAKYQWNYNQQGGIAALALQVDVLYSKGCPSTLTDVQDGLLKYVLDIQTTQSTMQLFVKSAAGDWGEVSPLQGGVIIPYLKKSLVAGTNRTDNMAYGYSECFKWGYVGSIDVFTLELSVVADVFQLNLMTDVMMSLTATGAGTDSAVLSARFQRNIVTRNGCQCKTKYTYVPPTGPILTVQGGQCINPTNDPEGAWCEVEVLSCTTKVSGTRDYCLPVTTLSGCTCAPAYTYLGVTYFGSCVESSDDPRGSWCVVDPDTCEGPFRAHAMPGSTGDLWDYCQIRTVEGCYCLQNWEYGGVKYSNQCRVGLVHNMQHPKIGPRDAWCLVEPACATRNLIGGHAFGFCTPPEGRVATTGEPCSFPTQYHGTTIYDCISYHHNYPGMIVQPWCFTDPSRGQWETCRPLQCTQSVARYCPSLMANTTNVNQYATTDCLRALCQLRTRLPAPEQCPDDPVEDVTILNDTLEFLKTSSDLNQQLERAFNQTNLDQYCKETYGEACLANILGPLCPIQMAADGSWNVDSTLVPLQICQPECKRALCSLHFSTQRCVDQEEVAVVQWQLFDLMRHRCGTKAAPELECRQVLARVPYCQADLTITEPSGTITDGSPAGGNYTGGSSCKWIIKPPDLPHIRLEFQHFNTEPRYDLLAIYDQEGLLGTYSGNTLPPNLDTDTGLFVLEFTSDASVEGTGFSLNYTASASVPQDLISCKENEQLLAISMKTRRYSSEISWVLLDKNNNSTQKANIILAGGQLPSSSSFHIPDVVMQGSTRQYKDYRTYSKNSCLQPGAYELVMYDSYGDGWASAEISFHLVANASCQMLLLSTTCTTNTTNADLLVPAQPPTKCEGVNQKQAGSYFIQVRLSFPLENIASFTLYKQTRLRSSVAAVLDVDFSSVQLNASNEIRQKKRLALEVAAITDTVQQHRGHDLNSTHDKDTSDSLKLDDDNSSTEGDSGKLVFISTGKSYTVKVPSEDSIGDLALQEGLGAPDNDPSLTEGDHGPCKSVNESNARTMTSPEEAIAVGQEGGYVASSFDQDDHQERSQGRGNVDDAVGPFGGDAKIRRQLAAAALQGLSLPEFARLYVEQEGLGQSIRSKVDHEPDIMTQESRGKAHRNFAHERLRETLDTSRHLIEIFQVEEGMVSSKDSYAAAALARASLTSQGQAEDLTPYRSDKLSGSLPVVNAIPQVGPTRAPLLIALDFRATTVVANKTVEMIGAALSQEEPDDTLLSAPHHRKLEGKERSRAFAGSHRHWRLLAETSTPHLVVTLRVVGFVTEDAAYEARETFLAALSKGDLQSELVKQGWADVKMVQDSDVLVGSEKGLQSPGDRGMSRQMVTAMSAAIGGGALVLLGGFLITKLHKARQGRLASAAPPAISSSSPCHQDPSAPGNVSGGQVHGTPVVGSHYWQQVRGDPFLYPQQPSAPPLPKGYTTIFNSSPSSPTSLISHYSSVVTPPGSFSGHLASVRGSKTDSTMYPVIQALGCSSAPTTNKST